MPWRLRGLDALDDVVEQLRSADPVELGGRVHLDRVEALRLAALGGLADLVRPVAADPGVGADLVAHLAAEHLPGRQAEHAALEVPQRLLEPRQRATSAPARRGRSRRDSRPARCPRWRTDRRR